MNFYFPFKHLALNTFRRVHCAVLGFGRLGFEGIDKRQTRSTHQTHYQEEEREGIREWVFYVRL